MLKKINKKGFTLIELIIALSIVSIILMAFYTLINSSIKQNTKTEKDIKSLNIAQSEVENLRDEIKSSGAFINIKDDNRSNSLVSIPTADVSTGDIVWKASSTNNEYTIDIKSDGIYSSYIAIEDDGSSNNEILQYNRVLEGDSTEYIVRLNISRQKKGDSSNSSNNYYIYVVEVRVKPENDNLSKKETVLTTSILSK